VCAALGELRLPADAVVMVGDTPYDIEAASRAGVKSIALRCGGGWLDVELHGAAAIYNDPADLLARLETSPLEP
jgi:phosphoglycolate phosphatase-like HAD superfamily hydrolase